MTPGGASRRENAVAVAAIVTATAAVVAVVGLRGDFPLSDDWSYAYSVRGLCDAGVLRFMPWTGASLVLQTAYGAALCRLFGFSFEILRLSTVILAASGAIGVYLMLGRLGVRARTRALATALFALDPLYVNLSFTFMTDVPCTVAAVWAGYCYVRGFTSRRRGWLVAGSVLAGAALLVRQHGIFVAAAASLAALAVPDRPWRERCLDAVAAGAVALVASMGFHAWLFAIHGAPLAVETKLAEAAHMRAVGVVNAAFRGFVTLAFLLSPLALAARIGIVARHPRRTLAAAVALGTLAAGLAFRSGASMFYLSNVMYDLGLGASSLRDTQFLGLRHPVELGPSFTVPLTLLALGAAALVAVALLAAASRRRDQAIFFVACATGALFLGSLVHTQYYFDRYLLVVLPFAIATITATSAVTWTPTSLVLASALAWYAVAGTHDYLAWNRARYAGLAELTAAGVPPEQIDGGMEYNGWTLAARLNHWPTDADARIGHAPTQKSWWWVVDDRFVVSFRPLPGYGVRQSIPFSRWLPPGEGRIVVLERGAS